MISSSLNLHSVACIPLKQFIYGSNYVNSLISFTIQKKLALFSGLVLSLLPKGPIGGSDGKASVYNVGDPGSSPGLGRSPGEGNGNSLQYYCLENPMDRGEKMLWQSKNFFG